MIRFWDDQPTDELIAYAHANAVALTWHVENMPQSFRDYAAEVVESFDYHVDHWHYWVTVHHPVADETQRWMPKFPHNHKYDGMTLVQYLEVPESGGELVIFDKEWKVKREYSPEVGMTAIIMDHELHGVRAVHGKLPRTVVIAGAFPFPKGSTQCRCPIDWTLTVNDDVHARLG